MSAVAAPAQGDAVPGALRVRAARYVPWVLAVATTAVYVVLGVKRFLAYSPSSWDLAIFTQAVAGYSRLEAPVVDIKGPGFVILGDHFSPVLALLGLPYRVWPTPVTLLVAQAVLIGVSVLPVARLAMSRLGAVAGGFVGLSYAVSYGLQEAVFVQFHEICFAVALLAFSLEAFVDRRWTRCVAFALPLVLVKEDLGLTVAVIGVLVAWYGPRRLGVLTALGGVAASALAMLVVIPAFNPAGRYIYLNDVTGADGGGSGPWWAGVLPSWSVLTSGEKPVTLLLFLAVSAGVALRSPVVLVAAPTLLWRLASTAPAHGGTDWHYDAILMPVAFVALVDGILRLRASNRPAARWVAELAVPAVVAAAILMLPVRPLATLAEAPAQSRIDSARAALARVPPGASVETDLGLMSHLVGDRDVHWLGAPPAGPVDYLVIDASSGWDPPSPAELAAYAEERHPGERYELEWTDGVISVVRRLGAHEAGTSGPDAAPPGGGTDGRHAEPATTTG